MSSDEMSVFEQDLQEIKISTSSITLIAYDTWQSGGYSIAPIVRWEIYCLEQG